MKINKKKYFYFILFILSFFIESKVYSQIIVSIKPIGFIAKAIVDNIIPVEVILPDGISEHDYFLKPSDLKKIINSDLLILVDPDLENFLKKSDFFLHPEKKLTLSSIKKLNKFIIYHNHDNYIHKNMHLWLSPDIAKIFAISIYEKIKNIIPEKKDILFKNLKDFEKSLNQLDKKIFKKFKNLKEKKYLVFHDAFSYFEKYYGLSPVDFITLNPLLQPGIKHFNKIKKKVINEKDIVCIFSEPQFKNNLLNKTFKTKKVKQGVLDPLGSEINLNKNSYSEFLLKLSNQYLECLK